jgi:hypothetical protein
MCFFASFSITLTVLVDKKPIYYALERVFYAMAQAIMPHCQTTGIILKVKTRVDEKIEETKTPWF